MERFSAKHILLIIRYVFGQVASDGFSYHCVHYIVPLIVKVVTGVSVHTPRQRNSLYGHILEHYI